MGGVGVDSDVEARAPPLSHVEHCEPPAALPARHRRSCRRAGRGGGGDLTEPADRAHRCRLLVRGGVGPRPAVAAHCAAGGRGRRCHGPGRRGRRRGTSPAADRAAPGLGHRDLYLGRGRPAQACDRRSRDRPGGCRGRDAVAAQGCCQLRLRRGLRRRCGPSGSNRRPSHPSSRGIPAACGPVAADRGRAGQGRRRRGSTGARPDRPRVARHHRSQPQLDGGPGRSGRTGDGARSGPNPRGAGCHPGDRSRGSRGDGAPGRNGA